MNKSYYTAHEIISHVQGLHTISTFNKWVNFIQKNCNYSFQSDYVAFTPVDKTKAVNHREVRVYTEEEYCKFQEVAKLIPKLGRDEALRKCFDPNYRFKKMSNLELLEAMELQVDQIKQDLQKEIHSLQEQLVTSQKEIGTLKQKIKQIEENSHSVSGWFRRKR